MTKDEAREILIKHNAWRTDTDISTRNDYQRPDLITQAIECAIQALGDGWVSMLDQMPTEQDGDENGKVLLYRNMNDNQKPLEKSIHDWCMVKNCDPTETFWQPLPPKPKQP